MSKSTKVTVNVGGVATFLTTEETLLRFQSHALSDSSSWDPALANAFSADYEIFVDQDARLFPRILQYLRAGHEHASFLDELSEKDMWELYEQVRDYYKIQPLLDQLTMRLFPVVNEAKLEGQVTLAMQFFNAMVALLGLFFPPLGKEIGKMATNIKMKELYRKLFSSPGSLLNQGMELDTDLQGNRKEFKRYNKQTVVAQSFFKWFAELVICFSSFVTNADAETKVESTQTPNTEAHPQGEHAASSTDDYTRVPHTGKHEEEDQPSHP